VAALTACSPPTMMTSEGASAHSALAAASVATSPRVSTTGTPVVRLTAEAASASENRAVSAPLTTNAALGLLSPRVAATLLMRAEICRASWYLSPLVHGCSTLAVGSADRSSFTRAGGTAYVPPTTVTVTVGFTEAIARSAASVDEGVLPPGGSGAVATSYAPAQTRKPQADPLLPGHHRWR